MMNNNGFHPLPLSALQNSPRLVDVLIKARLDDMAIGAMTDLSHAPCVTVDHADGLDATLHTMASAHVHMAFVTGVDDKLIGLITTQHLQGEKPMQRAMADHVHFSELRLDQLMTPLERWPVVSLESLAHARVGDIVATLREQSLRYLLVAEQVDGEPVLRGLFSARQLETALGIKIEADLHSRNFAELESVLMR
jgi:hypothetical protein